MAIQKERRATPRKPGAKPEPEKRAAKPKAPVEPTTHATTTPSGGSPIDASPDELRRLIEETAYYKAQSRGFEPGYELEDWVQAEAEVMRRMSAH